MKKIPGFDIQLIYISTVLSLCSQKPHQRIKLPVHELLYSKYPSSVIDITAMDIKQSPNFSDHMVHSHNAQRNELLSIMGGENTVIPHPTG